MYKTIPLAPRLSEKAYGLSQTNNTYVFQVPEGVNKHDIARSVSAQFDVVVDRVNVANISGKAKRTVSQGGRRVAKGKRSGIRKAYVTLAEGQSLPIFEAVEEAEQKEQKTQEQIDKAAAKQTAKDAKPARRGLRRSKKEGDK